MPLFTQKRLSVRASKAVFVCCTKRTQSQLTSFFRCYHCFATREWLSFARKTMWHWYHLNRLIFFILKIFFWHWWWWHFGNWKVNIEWPWERRVNSEEHERMLTRRVIPRFFLSMPQVTSNCPLWSTKQLPGTGMWSKLNVLREKCLYGGYNS